MTRVNSNITWFRSCSVLDTNASRSRSCLSTQYLRSFYHRISVFKNLQNVWRFFCKKLRFFCKKFALDCFDYGWRMWIKGNFAGPTSLWKRDTGFGFNFALNLNFLIWYFFGLELNGNDLYFLSFLGAKASWKILCLPFGYRFENF